MRSLLILLWISCLSLFSVQADLVDIHKFNPKIHVDFRYGTDNNYLGRPLYPAYRIYVDAFVATRLGRVQRDLAKEEGLGLIIYQGYRPPSVQAYIESLVCPACLWRVREEAPHYRKGLGVDVAIYYLDGLPLRLPTGYDDVTAAAYRDYPFLSCHVYHNRTILEKYMHRYGFESQREKWWHFDLRGWDQAPDLCIEYNELLCGAK